MKHKFQAPIIAPPPFELIPRKPVSAEDAAEGRLRVVLEREREMRVRDGLGLGGMWESGKVDVRDGVIVAAALNLNLGIHDTFRREVIEWMLDVCIPTSLPFTSPCLRFVPPCLSISTYTFIYILSTGPASPSSDSNSNQPESRAPIHVLI